MNISHAPKRPPDAWSRTPEKMFENLVFFVFFYILYRDSYRKGIWGGACGEPCEDLPWAVQLCLLFFDTLTYRDPYKKGAKAIFLMFCKSVLVIREVALAAYWITAQETLWRVRQVIAFFVLFAKYLKDLCFFG